MKTSTFHRYFAMTTLLALSLFGTACTSSSMNELASSDRECRTQSNPGSKMRQSVCMSRDDWARVDAREAERMALGGNEAAALMKRADEYRVQNPVIPGQVYNPYPAQ